MTSVSTCVLQNCTVPDALTVQNVSSTACGVPVRDGGPHYKIVSVTLGVISGVVILLRLGFKIFIAKTGWGLDDWFILATILVGVPSSVLTSEGLIPNGLGRDIWALEPQQITNVIHMFYFMSWLYYVQLALLKASLLFFYLKIFPNKSVRWLLWGTVIFNGISAISIVEDFWMLGIPLSQLRSLQLHWKKKVGVAIMFSTGTFVTVISIIRLQSLVEFGDTDNPTWDNLKVSLWSTIEINVGIITCCMPTLRLIMLRAFPRLSSTYRSTNAYYENNGLSQASKMKRSRNRTNDFGSQVQASNSTQRPSGGGIEYSREFTVQFHDADTSSQVELRDLDYSKGFAAKTSISECSA
ncbi:CFEM domain-containing protein [Diaporthe helianthi]|uniref:CFEM domain-containing protein n=1 Tax=Diaporthe helianthi TaxID=158607 RepID=A0A2P5I338_DIAHE|nr:CFEM domain-containing protein [Diaporthe helianthi]